MITIFDRSGQMRGHIYFQQRSKWGGFRVVEAAVKFCKVKLTICTRFKMCIVWRLMRNVFKIATNTRISQQI